VPGRLRRGVRRCARALGYDIAQDDGHLTLGAHLGTLFSVLGINCVIDVGAHEGGFAQLLRSSGYRGDIVSIEPVSESFEALKRHFVDDPRWRGHRFALGERNGTMPIRVLAATNLASLLPPSPYATECFGDSARVLRTEPVDVFRLDGILDRLTSHVAAPHLYLKVDTQGYDMRVVEGAGASLQRFLALQTELPVKALYEGVVPMTEGIERLTRLGFELSGMYPVCRDRDGLQMVEYDCVFVRSPPIGLAGAPTPPRG
jgi:FkbM family methyltransferase